VEKIPGLFQRLNFFKGLFVLAEDWQKDQYYHLEKRRYHNKYLHTPGVVFGCLGDLKVTINREGTALTIAPGYAIDGEGNDLFLPEPKEIEIPPLLSFNPPARVYITLRCHERETDERTNNANPQYSGFAFIEEDTRVEFTKEPPDNKTRIELARFDLSTGDWPIKNGAAIEIDLTQVQAAGTRSTSRPKALTLDDLGINIMDTTVQVRPSTRKQEDTNVLIEKLDHKEITMPMYMVCVQAMDSAEIQWWIECSQKDLSTEYSLHISNKSNLTSTVMCRVYRVRTKKN
jgi:hypothetical protein